MTHLQLHLAQRQALPVRQRVDGEVGGGLGAVGDDGAGGLRQLEVTGEEVGVEVGLEHPLDLQAVGGRIGEVLADVALGVHHHRPPGGGVAHQVAVEGEAGQIVLAEEEGAGGGGHGQASLVNIFWTSARA